MGLKCRQSRVGFDRLIQRIGITDFHIESLQIGNVVFPNVTGTVSPDLDKLIIGQDLFSHLKSWSINNAQGVLVLQQ